MAVLGCGEGGEGGPRVFGGLRGEGVLLYTINVQDGSPGIPS